MELNGKSSELRIWICAFRVVKTKKKGSFVVPSYCLGQLTMDCCGVLEFNAENERSIEQIGEG